MVRTLSAPGKLFLSGEYAVLWGGVARVAAVGARANALVRRREDREVHLVQQSGRVRGVATPWGVNWKDPVDDGFRFVAWTADLALRLRASEALGFEIAFAPSSTDVGGQKLGLGSSARATVLCAEACRFILESPLDTLKLSLLAHAEVQGGKGSGADVAAIFAGGAVRYRRYPLEDLAPATRSGQLLSALQRSAPVDLWRLPPLQFPPIYVYVGKSASTPDWIERVERRLTDEARRAFVDRSDELGMQLEQGLVKGSFPEVVEAVGELQALLGSLGPLVTEGAQQVLSLARSYGGAGKISGAGGGDGCVLFAPDAGAGAALVEALTQRGFLALPMSLESGLRGEPHADTRLLAWLDVSAG